MKRFALLLAAVVSGSGCVVETCDPQTLDINWTLVDSDGYAATCSSAYLSAGVDNVDVWINGTQVEYALPCTDGGVTEYDLAGGNYNIVVEGYDVYGNLIVRDVRDVYADSCGNTTVNSTPGEAYIDIIPSTCDGPGYLWYSLFDNTGTPYAISGVAAGTSLACDPGVTSISVLVPYGWYQLAWLEEVTSGGAYYYWGTCSAGEIAVFDFNQGTYNVTMGDTTTCP